MHACSWQASVIITAISYRVTFMNFSKLPLSADFIANLDQLGYTSMTPIQAESLPHSLRGKDIIAQGKTGSGKTVAFGISLLHDIRQKDFACQCLVMCPTRELAGQVAEELRKLARYQQNIKIVTLCGGQPIGPQIGSLEHGAHIVVGTPGRITDHLKKGTLVLDRCKKVVLDEADRMLDMGFIDPITDILEYTPISRQTLLFSATFPESIEKLSAQFQHQPEKIIVKNEEQHNTNIKQYFYQVAKQKNKEEALLKIINHYRPTSAVIFCNTKQGCKDLQQSLKEQGHYALALHGDQEQRERDLTLTRFANQSATFLIATDVAARGIDIDDIEAVINYDITRDSEVHVHRIGRTGRAGKKGLAISILIDSEKYKLESIASYMKQVLDVRDLGDLSQKQNEPRKPAMVTLAIDGGKKDKVRKGDILGALTRDNAVPGNQVGKIMITNFSSYVAVARPSARAALKHLQENKIKGRKFKVRRI